MFVTLQLGSLSFIIWNWAFTMNVSLVGLGLFVAKAIAESHGGTIEARDRANGAGACFEVRLPAV